MSDQLNRPVFIDSIGGIEEVQENNPTFKDAFQNQIKELFLIENPSFGANKESAFSSKEFQDFKDKNSENFIHIYYPWKNCLVKSVKKEDLFSLLTNRNKNIITEEEQKKLADFTVAITGLSVGGNIASTLIHNGFSQKIKLADFDTLDTTNLNRVRYGLCDIGDRKIDILSRELYETNPFLEIEDFSQGLSKENLANFVSSSNLIFEIIDDFEMKILLRQEAKKQGVPVVMPTSLGDSVLFDIERYDTEPETKIFNGMVEEEILKRIVAGEISEEDKKEYAIKIVGKDNLPERLIESVKEINKSLVGRPQLIGTISVAAGLSSFIARKIALGEELKSTRKLVKFNSLIVGIW